MKSFRFLTGPASAAPAAILLALSLTLFWGCKTVPPESAVEEPVPEPEAEPTEVPDPFITDWAGSTWILRDEPQGSKEFPGYRGFHLARDGRFLLINLDDSVGDTWSAEENILNLSLLQKSETPGLPLEGVFRAFLPRTDSGNAASESVYMRLVPTSAPASEGLIFEKVNANVDIVENHWIPREMEDGDTVPWPMNREIHLMLLPDAEGGMGILGYGGENRFRGSVILGVDTFVTGPVAITRKAGPATDYENLYVGKIVESNRYVQVEDDLFLYRDTSPKVAFRVRLFD